MLAIKNLTVKTEGKIIIKDFNLEIKEGEIHALMGKNGAGKSTIAKVLLRDSSYEITKGEIQYNGQNILSLDTTNVARLGFYLVGQNPTEIEGVTNAEILRWALNDQGKKIENILEFNKKLKSLCRKLQIPEDFIHRAVNFNMSGGEKKKNELLHIWMLTPSFLILDEIDSGLDIDALKLVANSLKEYWEMYKPSILVITHQKQLLDILKPTKVHIIENQQIIKSGDYTLAEKIFENGFDGATLITTGEENE